MDLAAATTTIDLSKHPEAAAAALQGLIDVAAIRNLAALYAMAVDDHDIERVVACFAEDGTFTRAGKSERGRRDLRAFFVKMMDRYFTTLHTPHSHVVAMNGRDSATGLTTGHAELSFEGTLMMAAYRYDDIYSRIDGRWMFQTRALKFMYVVPFREMSSAFVDRMRIRWPQLPYAEADFPESFSTWTSYR
jgi:uncharacterized protein (TIGR02246 family)